MAADAPDFRASQVKQIAWAVLVIGGGQVLVPLLLVAFVFNKSLKRHPTLIIYLLSWVAYSVSSCLLLYTGHQEAQPPHSLCQAQVALINASYMMIAFAAVSLMLQLRFTLPTVNAVPKQSMLRDGLLIALPPFTAGLYLILFYAARRVHPDVVAVERGRVTCRFQEIPQTKFFAKFTPILLGLLLAICLGMSLYLLHRTAQKLLTIRGWKLKDTLRAPRSGRGPWLRILSRFMVFGIYSVLTMVACLIDAVTPQGVMHEFVDYYVATLPLAAFSIFGTLPDIRKMWQEWRLSRTLRTSEIDEIIQQQLRSRQEMRSRQDTRPVRHISLHPSRPSASVGSMKPEDLQTPMTPRDKALPPTPTRRELNEVKGRNHDVLDIS